MNIGRVLLPMAAVAGLVALSACSAAAGDTRTTDGRLKVTASFYPMQYLAEQIGGSHVSVTGLTKPGTEPHDLELTPRQIGRLGQSGVVVYLKGLQPAVDEAIAQSGVRHIVDAASLTALEDHGTEVDGEHHTTGDNHSDPGPDEEDPHHHEDAGADPHIWLDPVKYAQVAEGVGRTLAQADPDHAALYAENTDALVKKLDALNTAFTDGLRNRTSDTFLTTHAAFGYLAERYGLVEEAVNGIDPEAEPSAARMRALQDLAKDRQVSTVFFETLVSDRTAKTLAGDLDLRTDVLDPIEGITDRSRGSDYFGVQRANLKALQTALGATT
ncbi:MULTISPECIES: metal ABC transporter substrate-binding protein [unclassified Streptomyces]|uniref:metal ABC transporter substrate-binding protein n=1 Tax=unclassified Streptomyces TaxID=2593676 RepID=UPI00382A1540